MWLQRLRKSIWMVSVRESRLSACVRRSNDDLPKMIAFFGPDGAGKSTQARFVNDFLSSNGIMVKRAWVRSTHTVAYVLWLVFFKLNLCRAYGIPGRVPWKFAMSYLNEDPYGAVSPVTMSPPVLKGPVSRFFWSVVELVGVLPVILLQVYVPLLLGHLVVAERYVIDSVASIGYFLDDEKFDKSWQASVLLSFVPRGTRFVFVDADYATIVARRGRFAGPQEYTEFHRRMFGRLAKRFSAVVLDSSKFSAEDLHEKLSLAVFA